MNTKLLYIDATKPLHANFEYRDGGFVIHKDRPYIAIGASPDGIVLEIKTQIKLLG